ncbi:hypothetical protein Ngar_c20200 [Candidatus Nitrososphaera gargensis Ga9.2]|uniref:Uncharacterized protein n=1 Tax=Nitrososphaera gargensis (strain Ga9.2) TaxID=1237085 RepID=K0IKI2_NITGG|nr:hypothetical protein [Candidatus Nitrososphaera gargensis]AFU58952.1 hypothetical protein Ngar_c20200 [Candidatus Nitrososphaera gargensis Ga9.2]
MKAGPTRGGEFGIASKGNTWARRFMAAAIIQGAIVVGLTVFLVLGQISILNPEVSRVIASGGAGTWFTFGYLSYILVGVIGVAVSSAFYHYLAGNFKRSANALAWVHLILMNVGTSATAGMMMYAGYQGGAAMLPTAIGGRGFDAQQAHSIMAPFVEPIAGSILAILVGVIAGGAGFLIAYRRAQRFAETSPTSRRDETEAA